MIDFIVEHKRYFITAAIGLIFSIVICFSRGIFAVETAKELLTILSDAFFAPGIIFVGLGAILLAANESLFDAISYGMKIVGRALLPKKGEKIIQEEFYEYHARVSQKKSKISHFFIVGGIFSGLSILFVVIYLFV